MTGQEMIDAINEHNLKNREIPLKICGYVELDFDKDEKESIPEDKITNWFNDFKNDLSDPMFVDSQLMIRLGQTISTDKPFGEEVSDIISKWIFKYVNIFDEMQFSKIRWISVNEAVPKHPFRPVAILLTDKEKNGYSVNTYYKTTGCYANSKWMFDSELVDTDKYEILAWMKFPINPIVE